MNEIVTSEKLSSPACLRIALVAYRDHPPCVFCLLMSAQLEQWMDLYRQDNTYITKTFQFTSDVTVIQSALKSLYASGTTFCFLGIRS